MHRVGKLVSHFQSRDPIDISISDCNAFEYTFNNKALTQEQREFYEANGYIVIKKLLSKHEIETFYNRFDELVENPKKRVPDMIVMRCVIENGAILAELTDVK